MIKGKTKSGIKYSIKEGLANDVRILTCLIKLDIEKDARTQMILVNNLLELIFGGSDGAMNFMNAVANAHEGICSSELLIIELQEIIEASKLKN